MRTTMLPTGMEVIGYNLNRRNNDLKFFEFGTTYHKEGDWFKEVEHLALYLTGFNQGESWRGANRRPVDLYLLKTYVANILERLGITKTEVTELAEGPYEYALTISKKGKNLATLGKVSPKDLKQFDIKQEVFYADLNWTELLAEVALVKVKYQPVPKFPGVRRDLALLLDKAVNYSEVEKIAVQEVKSILKSVHLFDKYEDPRLGDQKKSYAVSYFFEDNSKTLTDADVDKVMERLIARYRSALNAEIR
jgi:phenylalanyl-tRNA synthetase beta chain